MTSGTRAHLVSSQCLCSMPLGESGAPRAQVELRWNCNRPGRFGGEEFWLDQGSGRVQVMTVELALAQKPLYILESTKLQWPSARGPACSGRAVPGSRPPEFPCTPLDPLQAETRNWIAVPQGPDTASSFLGGGQFSPKDLPMPVWLCF